MARNLNPFRIALLGVITAGAIPLLQLRSRISAITSLQQQQLELTSELAGYHLEASDVQEIERAARRVRFPGWAMQISAWLAAAGVVCAALFMMRHHWRLDTFRDLLGTLPGRATLLQLGWMACIVAGFLLLYIQINRHAAAIQQFVLAFNAAAEGRVSPIATPPAPLGLRPVHLIVALVMMYLGWLWTLPMLLAWAAYTDFLGRVDAPFRDALSDRLQSLSGVTPVMVPTLRCANPNCAASLPEEAKFCPRCGQPVPGAA